MLEIYIFESLSFFVGKFSILNISKNWELWNLIILKKKMKFWKFEVNKVNNGFGNKLKIWKFENW